jgi:hypothetical protein
LTPNLPSITAADSKHAGLSGETCSARRNTSSAAKTLQQTSEAKIEIRNRRATINDGTVAGALAIVKAEKISASLDNEKLAVRFINCFASLRTELQQWLPLAIELRSRFETLRRKRKGDMILGCRTWEQFCQEKLGYSDRHVRWLMHGANPATQIYGNKKQPGKTKRGQSASSAAGEDLTDEQYVEKGVRAVNLTLRPLESNPPRFTRVGLKIVAQLREDFAVDTDGDSDLGNPGKRE